MDSLRHLHVFADEKSPRKPLPPIRRATSVCRKLWLNDPENTDEDRFLLQETSDNLISAILWTLLLIVCIIGWPVVLLQLVYWMIIKPDVTEFEEMHK